MKTAHEGKPKSDFPRPGGIVEAKIDTHSGKLSYPGDEDTMNELFLAGTEPTEVSEPYVGDGGPDAASNANVADGGALPVVAPDGALPELPKAE
jgi:penicillin-binding protein 1A